MNGLPTTNGVILNLKVDKTVAYKKSNYLNCIRRNGLKGMRERNTVI